MAEPNRSNAQVMADERTSSDGVETRAIGNAATPLTSRRGAHPRGAKRAESRGVYRDPITDARRIVGQGQVIPDGWTRIESASLDDRGGDTSRARHAEGDTVADPSAAGGARAGGGMSDDDHEAVDELVGRLRSAVERAEAAAMKAEQAAQSASSTSSTPTGDAPAGGTPPATGPAKPAKGAK